MKKSLFFGCLLILSLGSFAQDTEEVEEPASKFDVNRIFVGGSIGLGIGSIGGNSNSWSIGGFPQVGYSLTNWLDAGLIFNANYFSQRYFEDKYSNFHYGTGVFLRGFPFKSVFLQVQPEYNWISSKLRSEGFPDVKQTVKAPSLLVGIGYGQRMVGQAGFFTTLMFDVMTDPNSPYRDQYNSIIPILRGGFYVYLKGKKGRSAAEYQSAF